MFRKSLKNLLKQLALLAFAAFIIFHLFVLSALMLWKTQPVHGSMFMLSHSLFADTKVQQTWVDGERISKHFKRAAIASEDAKFTQHNGFDVDAMKDAMKNEWQRNEKSGKPKRGGSTISQQLAKNLFLTSHRSYIRKGEEAIITAMTEGLWSKSRILEVYLNVAEFGDGVYGVEAASQHYFKKSAAKVSKEQAALLIAMLPNPKYYQKHQGARRLQNKKRIILRRMGSASLPKAD